MIDKIKYKQEVMENSKNIYIKYNNTIEEILNNPNINYENLFLDALGVPFQNENGDNLSYSSNFLYTYLVLKKLKERNIKITDYLYDNPLFYILGYKSKGSLLAYLLYYQEELQIKNKNEFISNINNFFYMKKINKDIKEVMINSGGFAESKTDNYTVKDILNKELEPEEYYSLMLNIIIEQEISLVNQPEEYQKIEEELLYFFNSIFNFSIKKDEKIFQLFVMYLSDSVESLPIIYELKELEPKLWEATMELDIEDTINE
jgi:hypothetical protein